MPRSELYNLIVKLKGGKEAASEIKGVQSSFGSLKSAVLSVRGLLTGVSVGVLVKELYDATKAASDLQESSSKVITLFGSARARDINKWAEGASDAMGLSSEAALDAVGNIGNMFRQLSAGVDQSVALSKGLVQLSSDLASFHNAAGGAEEVLNAMQSAFRGEYDALQRYIPTINAAAVQTQAMADTNKRNADELTNLDKAMAAYKIIIRDAGAAAGDFERTSAEHANTTRRLDSAWTDFSATLGQRFLPAITKIEGATATVLKNLKEAIQETDLETKIAEAQAKYNRLIEERDNKEAVLARRREEREQRHQNMVESFVKRNRGPVQSESARIMAEFKEAQRVELSLPPGDVDIRKAKEYLDHLLAIKKERDEQDKEAPPPPLPPPQAKKTSPTADLEARIKRLNAWTDTQVANLENLWNQGLVSLENYFSERQNLIENQYQEEIKNLQKLAEIEKDPDKKLSIETKIYELQQQGERDLINLAQQRSDALNEVAEKQQEIYDIVSAAKERAEDAKSDAERSPYNLMGDIENENALYSSDISEMESKHEAELDAISEHYAGITELDEGYAEYRRLLDETITAHHIEENNKRNEHDKKIAALRVKLAAQTAGMLADIMYNLYKATGENNKQLLELYKALAAAKVVISTAGAIMRAYEESGPYMGTFWAVYLTALGAAQIATIYAQKLAGGGPVGGQSPHDKADNVPIWATAGEYMQPVSAVKYYGVKVMDAIRRRAIPRAIFDQLTLPAPPAGLSFALAEGGTVPPAPLGESLVVGDLYLSVYASDAASFADNPEAVAEGVRKAVRLGLLRGTL